MSDARRASLPPVPVVDLFAGPGGLGEGFSAVRARNGSQRFFDVRLSIEKDPAAHRTLELRAMYRWFRDGDPPAIYFQYLRGQCTREQMLAHPEMAAAVEHARAEAKQAELGVNSSGQINRWIENAVASRSDWVLLGGPPCQAYSLVGRARQAKLDREEFEEDHRHLLYEEYLRIVRHFHPAVFVMENVKGLLSATYRGQGMFNRICSDLSLKETRSEHHYQIRSFVVTQETPDPRDFVIRAEAYGVPQARHRVILLGVRDDYWDRQHRTLRRYPALVDVKHVLRDLPRLRSRISRGGDSAQAWAAQLEHTRRHIRGADDALCRTVEEALQRTVHINSVGAKFIPRRRHLKAPRTKLMTWLRGHELPGWLNHESRGHMAADLQRYLFAASYAKVNRTSPKVLDFPKSLLPEHKNITRVTGDDEEKSVPFADRFRVQHSWRPSTTVVSHIAKDGHYFIHYDPAQARSLTVREAARLQTFPDNYFFEGNRTQQFTQVGNAVPPFLALQLGEIVRDLLAEKT